MDLLSVYSACQILLMPGPLAGIRVIDMTTVVMGPYATQILGDMGAEVIKVESPDGDIFRNAAPMRNPQMGASFLNLNRNKRSIVLDLKREDDRALMLELLADADVFVSNTRPKALRKLGLDYESLKGRNPRLIVCGTYGFSEKGPYAGRGAFDDVIQAMSGLAALQGRNSSEGPAYVNTLVADKSAGLTAAYAIAMALYEREKSGLGQAIEVPMFEAMVSFNLMEHLGGQTFVPALSNAGYERVLSPHRRPYRTKDGYIGLLPYTTADWEAALRDADIPMAPITSPDDLLRDPHLEATGFFVRENHPSEGQIRSLGIPVSFSRTPGAIRRHAPRLDEHGEEIRRELAARDEDDAGS